MLESTRRLCPDAALGSNMLDFLRLSFALAVLFSHSFPLTQGTNATEPLSWLSNSQKTIGSVAVDGFFIISGFLIVRSWLFSSSMQDYFRKRVLRIHPAYIAAMFFSLTAASVGAPSALGYLASVPWREFIWSLFTLGYGALDAPALAFSQNPHGGVNASLWTIQLEFLAYIATAVYGLFGFFRYRKGFAILVLFMLSVYEAKVFFRGGDADAYWRFGCLFAMGGAFYLFRDMVPRSRVLFWCALFALAVGVFIRPLFNAALPLAVPYLLFYVGMRPQPNWARFTAKVDLSYGVYLYAFPVQQLLVHMLQIRDPLLLFVAATPITLICAAASWHGVERVSLRLKSLPFDEFRFREVAPSLDPAVSIDARVKGVQVDALVLERAPQPLDENVASPAAQRPLPSPSTTGVTS